MTDTRIAETERTEVPVAYPPAPEGQIFYVIGDIHGRRDLLERVHELIDADKARAGAACASALACPGSAPTPLVKLLGDRAHRPIDTAALPPTAMAAADPAQPQGRVRSAEGEVQTGPSAIGPDLTVTGRIRAKGEVRIEGRVRGDVHAARIVVGREASVEGSLFAAGDVLISGSVQGTIRGSSLIVKEGACVKADVLSTSLVVEQGSHIEGRLGRSDDPLAEHRDSALPQPPAVLEIYLGDYIDRGDDPRGVVDLLIERAQQTSTVFLRGNHEQCLLDFLAGVLDFSMWKSIGALSTLRSYGIQVSQFGFSAPQNTLRSALQEVVAPRHARFFSDTLPYFVAGPYLFVHAGLRPGIPLQRQQLMDLMGIRRQFLEFEGKFEHIVVHGHTMVRAPEFRHNRINLDTGAYASGRLSCLRIGADGPRLLEA
jgi:serine/threonine protein phosphatase 1